jgi:acyl-ACP thioesterase
LRGLSEIPIAGRVFRSSRRIRLGDMDARGRLRLDAVARFLQDAAIDDVDETGWGSPDHLWVLRQVRIDVLRPFLEDRAVTLETWCSSVASVAAGRRWSLSGDAGGSIEVDSVWIHLGRDARPARLDGFGVYAESANGRRSSTRLELPDPQLGLERTPWPLRTSDLDLFGHMNNAAYWQAVELLQAGAGPDPRMPYRAFLEYRHPIDLDDSVELVNVAEAGRLVVGFVVGDLVTAVGLVEPLGRRTWRHAARLGSPGGARRAR